MRKVCKAVASDLEHLLGTEPQDMNKIIDVWNVHPDGCTTQPMHRSHKQLTGLKPKKE